MAGIAPKRRVTPAARGQRFAVVVARFNEPISKKLLDGALTALANHAVGGDAVEVHWVPGSFELPQAAQALARTRRFAGIVCVGTVIKGATPTSTTCAAWPRTVSAASGSTPGCR